MKDDLFQQLQPTIAGNPNLRTPQREGFEKIADVFRSNPAEREVGIVLPVGCGKSGLITMAPFAVGAQRALVVAPGLRIAGQLMKDFDPTNPDMFYQKCGVLGGALYPEPAEIRGKTSNVGDLENADVVITNIHQLQGSENKWLDKLPKDFFDLILVDEGHHNVADSWDLIRQHFPNAKIVNFSATPVRADGQVMAGKIIYSFPIFRAIQEGYVKRLKAVVLNPKTLRYVRTKDGQEIEVDLKEVRRLGEDESDFRRSILSSKETLATIVDASIRELYKLRKATKDDRHKIIASALNYAHCIQIVEAYRSKGLRAEYIHSKELGPANAKILAKLEAHELDLIVQVRMLGEGFDHKYLSVAAVCSVFGNLSPFAQFVGRIMRVVDQNDPASLNNRGIVVFHAGANVARVWADFQKFSEADQKFFDELFPTEDLDFEGTEEIEIEPAPPTDPFPESGMEITSQGQILLEEMDLLKDEEVRKAFELLQSKGITADKYGALEALLPVPTTKQKSRQAAQKALDDRIRNAAGRILKQRGLNPESKDLDRKFLGRTNWVNLKSAIDARCNTTAGRKTKTRGEFTQAELDQIDLHFERILLEATAEVVDGKA